MLKKNITISLLIIVSLILQAHEFWLHPAKFFYAPGENLIVNFKVGEDFIGEPWKLTDETLNPGHPVPRIKRIELHQQNKLTDLKNKISLSAKDNLEFPLHEEGTHMVVMESVNSFSDLEAEEFNDYLAEDGLDDALALREKTNTLGKRGTELYARYSKLIVQVGKKTDDTFRKEAKLVAEIIPQQNPAALKVGDPVRFLVLFQGKPLFGARVKVWNRLNNRTTVQNIYSQQDGMIETHISNAGIWMVSFVKMVPLKDNPKAEWQSHWASLVFGIQ